MKEDIVKIYIGELEKEITVLPILNKHLGIPYKEGNKLFRKIFDQASFSFFALVRTPEEADFFLIPHDYFRINTKIDYIEKFVELSKKYSKKIVVFVYGDTDTKVDIPNTIILRTSQYRYKLSPNEIIMPPYVEDLLLNEKVTIHKKNERPVIGFCGWADFSNLQSAFKFWLKVTIQNICFYLLFDKHASLHKQGIFFRKKAISYLKRSEDIKTDFIIRKTYSGNKATIELSPEQARKEYIDNILNSDFTLCVKGDGNWSYRFYETLALGRLPLFVDTDISLPLEDKIDYGEFMVRVPHDKLEDIPSSVTAFYNGLTDEEYARKQALAHETFTNYLRIDSFLEIIFREIASGHR